MMCMWWLVGWCWCGEQEIVEGGSGMGFGLGANEIFQQLPFFIICPFFRDILQHWEVLLFKRHIVQIYLQAYLENTEADASD